VLQKHNVQLIVVFTSSSKFYNEQFSPSVGFDIVSIGATVLDKAKHTHKAAGLKSSIFALPLYLKTFGKKAL